MDKRQIIKDYIRDNFEVYPGYYSWKKDYFLMYSWIHWACQDILYTLALLSDEDAELVLKRYRKETEICLSLSKTKRSMNMFQTALDVVIELEGLF